MIQAAIPSLRSAPEVNHIVLEGLKRQLDLTLRRAALVERFEAGEIDLPTLRTEMRKLDRPLLTPKEREALQALLGKARRADSADTQATAPADAPRKQQDFRAAPDAPPPGIDPGVWRYMTPEERREFLR